MPAIESIDMTAMPTPYKPAKPYEMRIPTTMTIAGNAVACIETARPAIMLVAWPVIEALAIFCTGAYCVPV